MNPPIRNKTIYILVFTIVAGLPTNTHAQEWVVDLNEVQSLLGRWTEAHNTRNLAALERMYSDEVIFYAKTLPKVTCMDIKSKDLQSDKYFHLEVINPPGVTIYSSKTIKVTFTKQVTSGSSTTNYDAYLLLKQINGKLVIVGESDLVADGKAAYSPNLGKELKHTRLPKKLVVPPQDSDKPNQSNRFEHQARYIDQVWIIIIAIGGMLLFVIAYLTFKRLSKERPRSIEKMNAGSNGPRPPEEIGYAFEQFVVNRFDSNYFKIIEWRSDKIVNGIYPQSSKYPDLEIEFRALGECRAFAMECKYRRALIKDEFHLEKKQFRNYNDFKRLKKIQVYVALGLGGTPKDPTDLFLIPLHAFDANGIVHYNAILEFYDDPKYKFFYDLQKNELRHFRKYQQSN